MSSRYRASAVRICAAGLGWLGPALPRRLEKLTAFRKYLQIVERRGPSRLGK